MGDLSRIRVTGPLESYVSGFVAALVERGYTPVSAAHQLRLMRMSAAGSRPRGGGRMICRRRGSRSSSRRGALPAT